MGMESSGDVSWWFRTLNVKYIFFDPPKEEHKTKAKTQTRISERTAKSFPEPLDVFFRDFFYGV